MGVIEKILLMQMVFTCPVRFAGTLKEYERYLSGDYFLGPSAFLEYCAFCFCLTLSLLLKLVYTHI